MWSPRLCARHWGFRIRSSSVGQPWMFTLWRLESNFHDLCQSFCYSLEVFSGSLQEIEGVLGKLVDLTFLKIVIGNYPAFRL